MNRMGQIYNNKQHVESIHTMFSHAFDRAKHGLLLSKLEVYGITGKLRHWRQGFLTNRTQSVTLGGLVSDHINVTSITPHGSHCGLVLFNLFMNDLSHVNINILLTTLQLMKLMTFVIVV